MRSKTTHRTVLTTVLTVTLIGTQVAGNNPDCEFTSPGGNFSTVASSASFFCSTFLGACMLISGPWGSIAYEAELDDESGESCHIAAATIAQSPYVLPIHAWADRLVVSADADELFSLGSVPWHCRDGFCIRYGSANVVAFGPGTPAYHFTGFTFFTTFIIF